MSRKKGYRERIMIDTHIFIDYINKRSSLNDYVIDLLEDVNVEKIISIESLKEMLQKYKIGKLQSDSWRNEYDIIDAVVDSGFTIAPITLDVINVYAGFYPDFFNEHRDPSDHIIMCQSMALHIPLVAHDGRYGEHYTKQGLDLIQAD